MHGERVKVTDAHREIAVPIPRVKGWPCEFALYRLEKVESKDFTHRYRFQGVRRASYVEKLAFDGCGAHLMGEAPARGARVWEV